MIKIDRYTLWTKKFAIWALIVSYALMSASVYAGEDLKKNIDARMKVCDCSGVEVLLSTLERSHLTSGAYLKVLFLCAEQPRVKEYFGKITKSGDIWATRQALRSRLECSKDRQAFEQNSLLELDFNRQMAPKDAAFRDDARLLLNAGKLKEAKQEFELYSTTSAPKKWMVGTGELLKIAETDSQAVSDFTFKTNSPVYKERYLDGVRGWLKKYPDTLTASKIINQILERYGLHFGGFTAQDLAEFYRFRNERRYGFAKYSVAPVCIGARSGLAAAADKNVELKALSVPDQPIGGGWKLNICVAVDTSTYDISSMAAFVSRSGKDFTLGVPLPYFERGWHEHMDYYYSTAPVAAVSNPAGDTWLVHTIARDITSEVGYRASTYTVYALTDAGPETIYSYSGSAGGDGEESWGQNFYLGIDSSGRLLADVSSVKSEIINKGETKESIETKHLIWNSGTFVQISTSSATRTVPNDY